MVWLPLGKWNPARTRTAGLSLVNHSQADLPVSVLTFDPIMFVSFKLPIIFLSCYFSFTFTFHCLLIEPKDNWIHSLCSFCIFVGEEWEGEEGTVIDSVHNCFHFQSTELVVAPFRWKLSFLILNSSYFFLLFPLHWDQMLVIITFFFLLVEKIVVFVHDTSNSSKMKD